MNQRLIVIDGKTYKSVDEMPEDVRRSYENAMRNLDKNQNGLPDMLEAANPSADKNQDGTPDAFEGLAALEGPTSNLMSSTKIIVNGQSYDSLDQLPPEFRAKYEQALGTMDANRNGIPDFIEGLVNVPNQIKDQAQVRFGTQNPQPAARQPIPVMANIEPESSGSWLLWLAGILVTGLCLVAAGAGIWYFFLR